MHTENIAIYKTSQAISFKFFKTILISFIYIAYSFFFQGKGEYRITKVRLGEHSVAGRCQDFFFYCENFKDFSLKRRP